MRINTGNPGHASLQIHLAHLILARGRAAKGISELGEILANHRSPLGNIEYEKPSGSVQDALALLDAYAYPVSDILDAARALLQAFDPEQIYPVVWWNERLRRFGNPTDGHDNVFRGIASAIYNWSAPNREAYEVNSIARLRLQSLLGRAAFLRLSVNGRIFLSQGPRIVGPGAI